MRGLSILLKGCGLFLVCVFAFSHAYTQTCGFDHLNTSLKKDFPSIAQSIISNEAALQKIILQRRKQLKQGKREMQIYTIPIVVHILHTGESIGTQYNPTDAKIIEAIDYLNEVYSGKSSFLTPSGKDAAGDIGIRFALAKRDPDCNPTNGIDRVDMSANAEYVANGVNYQDIIADIALKAPIIWDKSLYYNIYIVNKINGQDGFEVPYVAGYAYLPTSSVVDGVVILSSQMKVGSTTLVHEIGHAFNLYHPFEGSNVKDECPVGEGDMVDDTDPISRNISSDGTVDFTCRTRANPCNHNKLYSIRTENNFMNYTACNTLFTPGQRERMLASLLLEDRKTLLSSAVLLPTYQSPACKPKINFEKAYAALERISQYMAGCRKYKDYPIKFTISSNPLKKTTVRLFIDTGTNAVENVDFSFPDGKLIVFPGGKHDTLSLNVRVFNDENYNNSRTLNLGFLLDDSTDALKGTAVKTMRIVLLPKDTKPLAPGITVREQVGVYDVNIKGTKIFNGEVASQNTQILYRAGELKSAGIESGKITGLSFFIHKQTSKSFKAINIKMGHAQYNELVKDGAVNAVSNMATVATLSSYSTLQGWNYFRFNTPFTWDGVDNVVVELCIDNYTNAGFGVDDMHAFADTGYIEHGNTIFTTGEGCQMNLSSISYYPKGVRPVVQFEYAKPTNPVADTIAISATAHLGPYAEIFFYDKSSPGKIIGKIKNLSNWNYGCTNISIDRCGSKVEPFLNNIRSQFLAQKTYFITPEKNNPNGAYELTLYYTSTEKNGYETGTGIQWQNIKMIKASASVPSISPQDPPKNGIEAAQLLSLSSYGSAYALTASFKTGFSAYGIGVINDIALKVNWLNVQVSVVNENNALLNWQTASEINNNYFEIEKSNDAVNFTAIGRVYSKGNSNVTSSYKFLDNNAGTTGKIYYRLKQVDNDGASSYSSTVYINFDNNAAIPSLYPVPATGHVSINFGKPVLNPVIEIFSIDMKLLGIYKKTMKSVSETINIQHLTSGNYIIRLSFEGKKYTLRFVKL
ncbi:MAG: T9SS type A sorting domain-containing protein [Chitinophagaceae bacterium]|nr:T9SS type A sorting domain-containing protein [Chitinophagaceae bacterium]